MKRIELITEEQIENFFSESNPVFPGELSKAIVLNEEGAEIALRCEENQGIGYMDDKVIIVDNLSNEEASSKKKGSRKR